jgi:sirohydrochlorin ferrochelatase
VSLVLVAHGTRKRSGVALIGELADRVASVLGRPVRTAFVDVVGPTPADILREGGPAVLVPAFLARGYHVTQDIPTHVDAAGTDGVVVTRALGPDPALVRVVIDRMLDSGWQYGDSVVLAAAGTSDPGAMHDLHTTATWWSRPTC